MGKTEIELLDYSKMPSEIVSLWPLPAGASLVPDHVAGDREGDGPHDRAIDTIVTPTLRVFLAENPDPNRPACVICPGGGYWILAIDKEGDDIARMLNRHGVTAFVLVNRLPDGSDQKRGDLPAPIADVQRAIRMVRAQATQWNVNPNQVGVMGFSAGGHVASTALTHFDAGNAQAADPIERQSSRPDFGILIYPVVTMHDPMTHVASREKLLGKNASPELRDDYSAEKNVTKQTPPLFFCHAEDDELVPVQNTLAMAEAARSIDVPTEVVLLKTGGHGFGLGVGGGDPIVWPGRLIDWLRSRGIVWSRQR